MVSNLRCNDMIADWVRSFPGKFVGTFTMPLKDMHLSLQEMERAVKQLGLKIANLPANVKASIWVSRDFGHSGKR